MKIQIGGVMSIGHKVLHYKSGKQEINVKRFTEAKLLGVSDYLPNKI